MMGAIGAAYMIGLGHLAVAEAGAKRMEQDAIERYKRALKLPRKKKKQEKKRALMNLSIARWSQSHFTF
jgi:uncharacterized protein YqiB (DUF1249 family)